MRRGEKKIAWRGYAGVSVNSFFLTTKKSRLGRHPCFLLQVNILYRRNCHIDQLGFWYGDQLEFWYGGLTAVVSSYEPSTVTGEPSNQKQIWCVNIWDTWFLGPSWVLITMAPRSNRVY